MPRSEDQGDRSKSLLSDDAVPQVEIPKAATRTPRTFKLPDAIGAKPPRAVGVKAPKLRVPPALGKVRAGRDSESAATASDTAEAEPESGKAGPEPQRPGESDAKYKERTLAWFKSGEVMEGADSLPPFSNEAFADGEASVWAKLPWPALVGGGVALAVLLGFILLN